MKCRQATEEKFYTGNNIGGALSRETWPMLDVSLSYREEGVDTVGKRNKPRSDFAQSAYGLVSRTELLSTSY